MRTLLKRLYTILITLVMTITIMPKLNFNCFAESEWVEVNSYRWEIIENGVIYITNPTAKNPTVYADCSETDVKDIVIPESVNGLTVTYISAENNEIIQTLKIPATVTWLIIRNCPNAIEFSVDKNNEEFCSVNGVIYDKSQKTLLCYPPAKEAKTFKIPDGVEVIGYGYEDYHKMLPFESCKYLENVIFPDSLQSIGICAFWKCNFEYIEFPDNVELGNCAFADNKKLKEIVIPENFKGCCNDTFEGCDSLETAVFLRKEPFKDRFSIVMSYIPPEMDCLGYVCMLDGINKLENDMKIYVPDGTVENYEYALGDVEINKFLPMSEKPKGECGDVNNNGKIDISDALDLQRYLVNKRSSTGLDLDVNGDGRIDVFDSIALKRILLKLTAK